MKLNIKDFAKVTSAVLALTYGQTAFGQTTDSQVFNVVVPQLVSIVAPGTDTIDTNIPANQVDGPMTFTGANTWQCTCNDGAGATVQFVAQDAFINPAGGTAVDADLTLAESADPNNVWTVSTATASTSGAGTTATVSAASTAPGDGSFDLTVVFDNTGGLYADLVAGTYTMTVVGTISGNTP